MINHLPYTAHNVFIKWRLHKQGSKNEWISAFKKYPYMTSAKRWSRKAFIVSITNSNKLSLKYYYFESACLVSFRGAINVLGFLEILYAGA